MTTLNNVHIRQTMAALKLLKTFGTGRAAIVTLFSNLSEYSSHCTPDFIRAESSLRGEGYWLWSVFVSPGGLLRDRQSGQRLSTPSFPSRSLSFPDIAFLTSQIDIVTPNSRPLVVARGFPLSPCLSHGAFAAAIIVWDERQCGTNTKAANAASPILARGHPECGMRSIINAISNVP
ncbi:hypothetical protein PoMZ_03275 [Pyricularia oryzae]|uniref:Uncharacterized protein n=1 Tax=Pyricularia oryzae TaxID=318829 RepID=A0A4V1C617_PYROR|nr:hypothetical protein PoMZ_03275 [Pyricularia oryzae]